MGAMKRKQNEYRALCIKACAGELTSTEKEALNDWLAASLKNETFFNQTKTAWQEAKPPAFNLPDIDQEWDRLKATLDLQIRKNFNSKFECFQECLKQSQIGISIPRIQPLTFSLAAAALLVICFLLWKPILFEPKIEEVVTQNGQTTELILPDDSRVRLNSGSRLTYSKPFKRNIREVRLEGEGFFEVSEGAKSFVVVTSNSRATVLGTEFNVWARGRETRVVVRSGSVHLHTSGCDPEGVVLGPNQMSRIRGDGIPDSPKVVDAEQALGWWEGRLVFLRTPLREIIAELERSYDVTIETDSNLLMETLTATFEDMSMATILTSICMTLDVDYRIEDGTYVIFR